MVRTPEDRLSEIELYELVAEEIENNEKSKGLWTKALSDSEGDMERAEALYIKLRVQMISDESTLIAEKQVKEQVQEQVKKQVKEQERVTGIKKEVFWLFLILAIVMVGMFLLLEN